MCFILDRFMIKLYRLERSNDYENFLATLRRPPQGERNDASRFGKGIIHATLNDIGI